MLVHKLSQIIKITCSIFSFIFQYIKILAEQLNALMNYMGKDPLLFLCNVVLFYDLLCVLCTHAKCCYLCYVLLISWGGDAILSICVPLYCSTSLYILGIHSNCGSLCSVLLVRKGVWGARYSLFLLFSLSCFFLK